MLSGKINEEALQEMQSKKRDRQAGIALGSQPRLD